MRNNFSYTVWVLYTWTWPVTFFLQKVWLKKFWKKRAYLNFSSIWNRFCSIFINIVKQCCIIKKNEINIVFCMLLIQIKCVDLKWEVNRMQMSIMCIADVDKVFFFFISLNLTKDCICLLDLTNKVILTVGHRMSLGSYLYPLCAID